MTSTLAVRNFLRYTTTLSPSRQRLRSNRLSGQSTSESSETPIFKLCKREGIGFISRDHASRYAASHQGVRERTNENKASILKKVSAGTIREHCESSVFKYLEGRAENDLGEQASIFTLSY